MSQPLTIIIVEKQGNLKTLTVKDFKEDELFKKCGFKTNDGFNKQTEWKVKYNSTKYYVQVFGKSEGRANNENKYDFPPPIDNKLFFGNCVIICYTKIKDKKYINLTIDLWEKLYEKLFGGFEDLSKTAEEDENEVDELSKIPDKFKTKTGGYLKDGFVVDSDDTEENEDTEDEDEDVLSLLLEDEEEDDTEEFDDDVEEAISKQIHKKKSKSNSKSFAKEETVDFDIGSELSEDEYD
jgi:hypothetical protein